MRLLPPCLALLFGSISLCVAAEDPVSLPLWEKGPPGFERKKRVRKRFGTG